MRVGTGYDLHRMGAERPLVLAGVEIPDEPGLHAHSDGDVVLHALTDALLGAAGHVDIGELFPDDDPAYEDADSRELLQTAMGLALRDYKIINVDCTILAERPKLQPYREAMQHSLATLLGITASQIGMKFTTMEGLGAIGRGEAMACHVVCLIETR